MMTPRQKRHWDRLQDHPVWSVAIERFGLEPVESSEFRRNELIAERVEGILGQLALAPYRPRRIERPRSPFENPDLSYLKPGEVPF